MGKSRLLHREQVAICMEGCSKMETLLSEKEMTGRVEMSRRGKTVRARWRGPDFYFQPPAAQEAE